MAFSIAYCEWEYELVMETHPEIAGQDSMPNMQEKNKASDSIRGDRVFLWLIFTLLLSMLPFLFAALLALMNNSPFSIDEITKRGELLISACILSFSAIGELLEPKGRHQYKGGKWVYMILFIAIGIGGVSAFLYGVVIGLSNPSPSVITVTSLTLFVLSAMIGLVCVSYE